MYLRNLKMSRKAQTPSYLNGDDVFSCREIHFYFFSRASGVPPPAITWNKDEAPYTGSGTVVPNTSGTVTESTLTISGDETSDAGTYSCVAANAAGNVDSTAATLTVRKFFLNSSLHPPKIW